MIYKNESSPRVQRKRLAKQEQILGVAMGLLTTDGLDAVTITNIAEEMDLTVGALYRYFPSKTAILSAVTVRTLNAFAEELEKAAQTPGNALERLHHIAAAHIAFSRDQPSHAQLIGQMVTSPRVQLPPDERREAMQPAFELIEFLEQHLRAAQDEGLLCLDDPRAHALMFWSSIQGAMQLDKLGRLDPAQMYRQDLPLKVAAALLKAWSTPNA